MAKDDCKLCTDYTHKIPSMHKAETGHISLYEHYLQVTDEDRIYQTTFKIKYCPMCGKNLGDGK